MPPFFFKRVLHGKLADIAQPYEWKRAQNILRRKGVNFLDKRAQTLLGSASGQGETLATERFILLTENQVRKSNYTNAMWNTIFK